MKENHLVSPLTLQLFAEEGAASGATETAAASQETGENSAVTAQADVPDAEVQSLDAEFEELIKGKFKQAYDARVQNTISRRLKSTKEIVDRYNALSPMLRSLAEKYGVDASDTEGLRRALEGGERRETAQPTGAQKLYETWRAQEQETKKLYPAFDMAAELRNERFQALLRSHVDVQTAYEVLHKNEIIPAAMAVAAKAVEGKIAKKIAAGGARPAENGMGGRAPAVTRQDVSKLTKSDIDEVARRVARGERVTFG